MMNCEEKIVNWTAFENESSIQSMERRVGPYIVRASRPVYKNPWIDVREDQVVRPDGTPGSFGVITMREGSSVLPIDAEGFVYLVTEFKYGIESDSTEVVSGGLDAGESPLEAAKRELAEELGLFADEWISLKCVHPFTTVVQSPNHIFLAKGLRKGKAQPDGGELLTVMRIDLKEAVDMVMRGEIIHSASCVAILKAARLLGV